MDRISPNVVYVCILTISRLGLLPVIAFCFFYRSMALDWSQKLFVLNIYIFLLISLVFGLCIAYKRRSSLG